MRTVLVVALLICTTCSVAFAIKISLFMDTDTFIKRANDIVVAECTSIPPQGVMHDGLRVVEVNILKTLKGSAEPGPFKIATIYEMKPNTTYMLYSLGGSALGTDFLAIPELSVVPLPAGFKVDDLEGKVLKEQVQYMFSRRLNELERELAPLLKEKELLEKAVSDRQYAWYTSDGPVELGPIEEVSTQTDETQIVWLELAGRKLEWSHQKTGESGYVYFEKVGGDPWTPYWEFSPTDLTKIEDFAGAPLETRFYGLFSEGRYDKSLGWQASRQAVVMRVGQVLLARTVDNPQEFFVIQIEGQKKNQEHMSARYTVIRNPHAQQTDNPPSPVTMPEQSQEAPTAEHPADEFEVELGKLRRMLAQQSDPVEWLRLARKLAIQLEDVAGELENPADDPRYQEAKSIYREILRRFDHMDFYEKEGPYSVLQDSFIVPLAAFQGIHDYPRFLSMMQDFHDQRVKDWLAEPIPAKPPESALSFSRHKHRTHGERVASWLERRTLASEGRVFSQTEIMMIEGAAKNYTYQCRQDNEEYDSVPGLAELGTHYTAPDILDAIRKHVEIETPPFPRMHVAKERVVEHTVHTNYVLDNEFIGASKVDFDTGTVVNNPLQWSSRVHQSIWAKRGGIDIQVDHHRDFTMNFITFDLELIEVPGPLWDETPDSWAQLKMVEIKAGALVYAWRDSGQMEYTILAHAELPATLAFKTREGGIGLLQITDTIESKEKGREYSIRYRIIKQGEI